jgi:outer membrane protein
MTRAIALLSLSAIVSTSVHAHEQGSWMIRAGLANVDPDASSSALVLDGVAVGNSGADVDDNTQLGLTVAYMLTDAFAVELLASTPFEHDISASTGALGLGEISAGKTKHLPPTVSLLYYPLESGNRFQPYVGAGINYTLFFDEKVDAELEGVLGEGSLELDPSWGFSAQIGFDYMLTDTAFVNGSLWWFDIDTDADFQFAANRITTEVDIDPLAYQLTLGWRF